MAAECAELLRLVIGLDSFGDYANFEIARDLEKTFDNGHASVARRKAGNEAFVDLDDVNGHGQPMRKGGVARPDIVESAPQDLGADTFNGALNKAITFTLNNRFG